MTTRNQRWLRSAAVGLLAAGTLFVMPAGIAHAATGCSVVYYPPKSVTNGSATD